MCWSRGERAVTFLSPSQASGSPQYDGGRGGFLLPCVLFENLRVCLSGPSIQVLGWEGNLSSQFLFNYTTCGSQLHLSTMCVSGMEVRPWGLSTKHPCPQPSWRPCYFFSRLKLHTYTQPPPPRFLSSPCLDRVCFSIALSPHGALV